jgi:hypothetical protein
MQLAVVLLLCLAGGQVQAGRRSGGSGRSGGSRSWGWGGRRAAPAPAPASSSSSWGRSSRGSSSYPRQAYKPAPSSAYKPSAPAYKPSAPAYRPSAPAYSGGGRYTAAGGQSFGYSAPGHGTSWGTSFPGGVGRYGSSGVSKKALGLGVGAGFLGGAALGMAGTMATYGVYHRWGVGWMGELVDAGTTSTSA